MSDPEISINFMHQGQPQQITAGLYFGMPEDLYHAIPALSSTGMKNLLVSPPDFWFNSWLNPLRAEDAEDDEAKEWRIFGRASHTRILEGKEIFDTLYCVEFIAPEGCLDTKADLQRYCDDNGISYKKSWNKPEYISTIQACGHNPLIYDVEKEKYYRTTSGRIQLSQKDMRRIAIAASMIENHQELKYTIIGGYAEVTIIWFDEELRLWFKARVDRLKPQAIVDLKTFTNKHNMPIDQALYLAMAGLKYHIQVGHYSKAAEWAIKFAKAGMISTYGQRFTPSKEFLEALANSPGHEFYFIFQKKGGAPLARGKKFPPKMEMMKCAVASIEHAIMLFKQYSEMYGEGVWVDNSPITDFEDAMFPTWATQI